MIVRKSFLTTTTLLERPEIAILSHGQTLRKVIEGSLLDISCSTTVKGQPKSKLMRRGKGGTHFAATQSRITTS